MYFGKFKEISPCQIKAQGALKSVLENQNEHLSSHYPKQGFPFNTSMWDGGVGKTMLVSTICHDESVETPMHESWWPYEQSAYLLDGILRLGILLDDKNKIELFKKNLDYVLQHPDRNGLLGFCYNDSPSLWPMAVFFRAVKSYYETTHDDEIKKAFHRHYTALDTERIAGAFRNINTIEGMLCVYDWTGDGELLKKAVEAYQLHNLKNSPPSEDEFELPWKKLSSGNNFVIHGVSFSEAVKLPVLLYLYTGNPEYLQGAEKGLAGVLTRHEQIPGLPSSNEDFAGRDPLQGYETCLLSDFTWALGIFLMATGKSEYADRIEKIIYNALPGSISDDFCTLQYLSSPNQVIAADSSNHSFFFRGSANFRQYRSDHSAMCCPGNIHRAFPNFVLRTWMTDDCGAPVAALYGASTYSGNWNGKSFTFHEKTDYPYSENITFIFNASEQIEMPFSFRIPGWCRNPEVTVNGKKPALKLVPGEFVSINRKWSGGDRVILYLPMIPEQKHDRYWSWFELGPLVFSLPVAAREERENCNDAYSPRNLFPESGWNYGVVPGTKAEIYRNETEPTQIKLRIPAYKVTGFDELEQGRYTPEIPLFCSTYGAKEFLTLQPYGSTNLRITAFPDAVERKILPIYQTLVSKTYPYNEFQFLKDQVFLPEVQSEKEILNSAQDIQMDHSGFCDLIHHFGPQNHVLAYLLFRIWADEAGEAEFAVGTSDGAECFVNGQKCYTIEPPADGEFMAPFIFTAPVKKGFNLLMLKVCESRTLLQYRKAWGGKATVFLNKN